jgi:hypothetical protein
MTAAPMSAATETERRTCRLPTVTDQLPYRKPGTAGRRNTATTARTTGPPPGTPAAGCARSSPGTRQGSSSGRWTRRGSVPVSCTVRPPA